MVDIAIAGLTLKATPEGTDEIALQETGTGDSFKTTLQDVMDDVQFTGDKTFNGTVDILTGTTTNSSFHLGEVTGEGGYMLSTADHQFAFSGGAEFVSNAWTARSTTASIMRLENGAIIFTTDDSLTDGNTFTPTTALTLAAADQAATFAGTTIDMVVSGTTLTVGVGADNGTVSAGVFTDRTKAFEGDALSELKAIRIVKGQIDHDTLPEFTRARITRGTEERKETMIERDLGATISMQGVAIQQLLTRIIALEPGESA